MIAILLVISLLQLSTAAVLKQSDSMALGLDDSLGAMLYELPDYEDPQQLEYELSKLEDHPLVSLIHLARKHVHNKNRHVMSKEAITNFKLQLDSVITRLQTVQERIEKDSSDIPVEDIEKSIQDLTTLAHIARPNIEQLMTSIQKGLSHSDQHPLGGLHQGLPHSELHPRGGLLNVRSKHPPAVEVTTTEADIYEFRPLTTEAPVHDKKPIAIKPNVHEIEPPTTKPPIHEIEYLVTKSPAHKIEPPTTKPPVYETKPVATEEPDFALPAPSTEAPKETSEEVVEIRRAPYKDQVFKGESMQERYEMNPYQSRWTWKTAEYIK